ncbi:glycoside hydrolase family 28 protein [Streptomyces sp. NPDC003247]|uniref:glycoside hydrolase family 28 protein n=1 Tax=Streptomyces sp. NPDC003247 TaxID=3364677 RepID=UPI00367C7EDF
MSPHRPPRKLLGAAVAACLSATCLATATSLPAAAETTSVVQSTGTVVVAKAVTHPVVYNVGTTVLQVRTGATVPELLAELTTPDGSPQTRTVVGVDGQAKTDGPVTTGDTLAVVAEDGVTTGSYDLTIHDSKASKRDGVYWNQKIYDKTDSKVNAHTPVFPNRVCDPTGPAYAALVREATETYATGNEAGDASDTSSPLVYASQQVWYYGDAINAAIKDCHDAGGGIVELPADASRNTGGAYYSGAITLLSNVNLRIDSGAVVKFMRNKTNDYYPVVRTSYEGTDLYNYSPFVYAYNQHDIALSGGGTLDGQEDMWNWRPWKKGYWGELSVENTSTTATYGETGILNKMNFDGVPVEQRIFTDDGELPDTIPVADGDTVKNVAPPAGATALKSTFRPQFIETNASTDVLIEDVVIRNTPFWTVHPLSSANVLIRGLDIYSNKTLGYERTGWNNDDGLDPESTQYVVMEDNKVTVSDDGAAIKAGRNRDGRELRAPSQNIIVRDSEYRNDGGGSAAVSMGSEMSGGIRNVFIHDNVFGGSGLVMALKLKTNAVRGGVIENIYMRHCTLQQAYYGLVQFDSNYSETVPFANADVYNPAIRNIYLDDVDTTSTMTAGKTTFVFSSAASRSPAENVHYRNSVFHTTSTLAAGFSKNKFIKNFVVQNVTYINPTTGATTSYDTTPLNLLDATTAETSAGTSVPLTAAAAGTPDVVTALPSGSFRLSGKIDLAAYPTFLTGGTVKAYVDRSTTSTPVTVQSDGTFLTDPITLDDTQAWYTDRHYVAVNIYNGIDINTMVYQVATVATA